MALPPWVARLYNLDPARLQAPQEDALSTLKSEYRRNGGERSNRAYGYVRHEQ